MTSDALAAYEQAIRLAPGNPDDWIGKAEVLVKSGRRTESLEAFREALRVKPGYLAASLRLARVQQEIGRGQSDATGPG